MRVRDILEAKDVVHLNKDEYAAKQKEIADWIKTGKRGPWSNIDSDRYQVGRDGLMHINTNSNVQFSGQTTDFPFGIHIAPGGYNLSDYGGSKLPNPEKGRTLCGGNTRIEECPGLKVIDKLPVLLSGKELIIRECENLTRIPDFESDLSLIKLPKLKKVGELTGKSINFRELPQLVELNCHEATDLVLIGVPKQNKATKYPNVLNLFIRNSGYDNLKGLLDQFPNITSLSMWPDGEQIKITGVKHILSSTTLTGFDSSLPWSKELDKYFKTPVKERKLAQLEFIDYMLDNGYGDAL